MALIKHQQECLFIKEPNTSFWSDLFNPKGNKLAKKMLFYILLCSSCLAVLITLVQLAWDYKKDVSIIEESLQQIESSFIPPISASLWNIDKDLLETQIEGILKLPNMQYVQVKEYVGEKEIILLSKGVKKKKFDLEREFNLAYQEEVIGRLFVAISLEQIYNRLIEKAVVILVSQVIKTLVVSLIILFIIYQLVMRHLGTMVKYTRNLDLETLHEPLKLARKEQQNMDELGEMVSTFNQMREKIAYEFKQKLNTSRKLAEEQGFSATIINASNTIITCLDANLLILSCNPAGLSLTIKSEQDLKTKSWLDIFCDDTSKKGIELSLRQLYSLENKELSFNQENGKRITLLWRFVSFSESNTHCKMIAFGQDITDIKKVEEEIKTLNNQLEKKVNERTKNLEASNKQLSSAFKQLKDTQDSLLESEKMASLGNLVTGVAHEINTPIGISITAISYMQEHIKNIEEKIEQGKFTKSEFQLILENFKESIELLLVNQHRAAKLIKNFKKVSVNQSSGVFSLFNLRDNLELTISSHRYEIEAQSCNIQLNCEPNLSIKSYPVSFSIIFSNLIINSIHHGFENFDGEHKINIHVSLESDNMLIEYSDNGRGVDEHIANNIFDPFVTSNRSKGGSGLGTHIVYNLVVQLLKGEIKLSSQMKKGVNFKIRLPYEKLSDGSLKMPKD